MESFFCCSKIGHESGQNATKNFKVWHIQGFRLIGSRLEYSLHVCLVAFKFISEIVVANLFLDNGMRPWVHLKASSMDLLGALARFPTLKPPSLCMVLPLPSIASLHRIHKMSKTTCFHRHLNLFFWGVLCPHHTCSKWFQGTQHYDHESLLMARQPPPPCIFGIF